MPKVSSLISDDYLLKNLDTISGLVQIIPPQVGTLLGISNRQLEDNRANGDPPKFVYEGSAIRYRVGDVRDYLNSKKVFNNTLEALLEKNKKKENLDIEK